jgi:hypothetical protein
MATYNITRVYRVLAPDRDGARESLNAALDAEGRGQVVDGVELEYESMRQVLDDIEQDWDWKAAFREEFRTQLLGRKANTQQPDGRKWRS